MVSVVYVKQRLPPALRMRLCGNKLTRDVHYIPTLPFNFAVGCALFSKFFGHNRVLIVHSELSAITDDTIFVLN